MTRLEELTREANKLQGELLALVDMMPGTVGILVKPLLKQLVGRLHFLHLSLIEELKRRES